MITQQKSTAPTNFKTAIDLLLFTVGVVGGGVAALVGLWLWFDYQAGPANSLLAQLSGWMVTGLPPGMQQQLSQQAGLMGLPLAKGTSAYWYMARAGGITAYLLLWFSTVWGLLLSTKIVAKQVPAVLAYGIHEFVSILTIIFAALHAAALLGDEYIKFNIFHLVVPFTSPYEPFWTGLGILALYLGAAITASFYLRQHIGQKMWRKLHTLTFVAYLLALLHGINAGSDTGLILSVLLYWSTGFAVVFLMYYRLFTLLLPPNMKISSSLIHKIFTGFH